MIKYNYLSIILVYTLLFAIVVTCNIITYALPHRKGLVYYSSKIINIQPTWNLRSNEGNHYDDIGVVARHFSHRYHAISAPEKK